MVTTLGEGSQFDRARPIISIRRRDPSNIIEEHDIGENVAKDVNVQPKRYPGGAYDL